MTNNETNMEVYRRGTLKDGYTMILNQALNDKELTSCPEAVVVFLKLQQYMNSATNKISIRGISTQTGLSVGKVGKAFKKLIELGYVSREPKFNGNIINGYRYGVYDIREENVNFYEKSTNENSTENSTKNYGETIENSRCIENRDIEMGYIENMKLINKISKKENKKKENKDVVVGERENSELNLEGKEANKKLIKETMIIELYKTYKIQNRVMPQMKKLLLSYADKIDIELYEEIFMLASEDNVKSKYKYIQDLLVKFDTKGIYTLEAYKLDCENFKSNKQVSNSNSNSKSYKGAKNGSKDKKVHTRYHDVNNRLDGMSENYIDETLAIDQYIKFNSTFEIRKLYMKAMNLGLNSLGSDEARKIVMMFAFDENLEVPK